MKRLAFFLRNMDNDTATYKEMVYAINREEVAPEDRLSDSVYFYDAKTKWFSRLA